MRKNICILLCFILILLCGCSNDSSNTTEPREESQKETEDTVDAAVKDTEEQSSLLGFNITVSAVNNLKYKAESASDVSGEAPAAEVNTYDDNTYTGYTEGGENYTEAVSTEAAPASNSVSVSGNGEYTLTAYTWTGNPMANGEYPYEGSVASCDFPLGTVLYIEGIGNCVVNDVCPTSGVIDIYMDTYDECVEFGCQSGEVYLEE